MATPSPVRAELFGPERRATTIGLVLLISLVAFEAMGVGTAMPALVADLGAVSLYSWPFVTFLAASVLATVVGGRWSDRAGPRPPILVGPVLFGVGLLVAGTATAMPQLLVGRVLQGLGAGALAVASFVMIAAVYPERLRPAVFGLISSAWVLATVVGGRWSDRAGPRPPILVGPVLFGVGLLVAGTATAMPQLLVGRVLQGLGAGALSVASFVMIAAVYPERLRPAVFGLISSAWVLPSLLGPPVAGIVTETLSWHWVFLGLVPLVVVALALLAPAVRHLKRPEHVQATRRGTAAAAIGTAVGVAALSWAGQHPDGLGAVVAVIAIGALVPSLRVLLPRGVFRAGRGIPTVVASRGLLSGTFFTVNAFLPLMLNGTHGWSLAAAGIPLVAGSLSWSASSAWQGRHPGLPRARLLRAGFVAVAIGAAGMLLVAPAWGIGWLAVPFWMIAGVGMGLGFSSVSFLVLAQSPEGTVGFNSAAAQMADQLSVATMVGAGGALLALLSSPAIALPLLVAIVAVLALVGVAIAGRAAG